jgi:hypothetical protein
VLRKTLILSAWILMLLLSLMIVAASIYAIFNGIESTMLEMMASAVMGFYFGTFATMVSNYLKIDNAP